MRVVYVGAVVPREVSMRDLFLAVRAVLRSVNGGIEAAGLSAESGVPREMVWLKATTTCWAVTHLVPANTPVFGRWYITYVFLVTRPGFLSLNGLYHIFSKLKMTKYFGINLMKTDAQKRADFRGQKWLAMRRTTVWKEMCNFGQKS